MVTEFDRFKALLVSLKIDFTVVRRHTVRIGPGDGYPALYHDFEFSNAGYFARHAIWEDADEAARQDS